MWRNVEQVGVGESVKSAKRCGTNLEGRDCSNQFTYFHFLPFDLILFLSLNYQLISAGLLQHGNNKLL